MKESLERGRPLEVLAYSELERGDEDCAGRETGRNADCEDDARKGGMEPYGILVGESSRFRIPLRLFGSGGSPDKELLMLATGSLRNLKKTDIGLNLQPFNT